MGTEADNLDTASEEVQQKLKEALTLYHENKLEEAHAVCDKILAIDDRSVDTIYLIALISIKIDGYMNAGNLLLHAIGIDDTNPDLYFTLGFCLSKLDWSDQCIQAYQKCIIAHPQYFEAYQNLAMVLAKSGDHEAAIKCFKKAIEIKNDLVESYVGLSLSLKALNHPEDAIESLEVALKLKPELSEIESDKAKLLDKIAADSSLIELEYGPPAAFNSTSEASSTAKSSNRKVKPKIRVVQHLAMSGGALFMRCLGCMNNVSAFNNIHPMGANVEGGHAVNIFGQASNWFHLFEQEEIRSMEGTNIDFLSAVKMIHERIHDRDDIMLIRDWSHLDFVGIPFHDKRSNKFSTAELLSNDFEVLKCTTVCHPLDLWKALSVVQIFMEKIDINVFMECYHNFAKEAVKGTYFKYEDLLSSPNETLMKMCSTLEIPFDEEYSDRWKFFTRFPAEIIDEVSSISPAEPAEFKPQMLENAEANFDYWPALELLSYEHKQ